MARIGTVGRVAAARTGPARDARVRQDEGSATEAAEAAGRALVVIEGGRREEPRAFRLDAVARPGAGFVAQLLVAADPGLRPSRLERTRTAAACYAEAARRLA